MPAIKPTQTMPSFEFSLLSGERFSLAAAEFENLLMVVVYRGLHCPVCKNYLRQLQRLLDRYNALGVSVVAVSSDVKDRALEARDEWGVEKLEIGYGLTVEQMRDWDLYISTSIKDGEPAIFAEPAVFLFKPNKSLYYAALNSMPFGRPDLEALADSIEWLLENDYPARGIA